MSSTGDTSKLTLDSASSPRRSLLKDLAFSPPTSFDEDFPPILMSTKAGVKAKSLLSSSNINEKAKESPRPKPRRRRKKKRAANAVDKTLSEHLEATSDTTCNATVVNIPVTTSYDSDDNHLIFHDDSSASTSGLSPRPLHSPTAWEEFNKDRGRQLAQTLMQHYKQTNNASGGGRLSLRLLGRFRSASTAHADDACLSKTAPPEEAPRIFSPSTIFARNCLNSFDELFPSSLPQRSSKAPAKQSPSSMAPTEEDASEQSEDLLPLSTTNPTGAPVDKSALYGRSSCQEWLQELRIPPQTGKDALHSLESKAGVFDDENEYYLDGDCQFPYLHIQDDLYLPHYEEYVVRSVQALAQLLTTPPDKHE